MTRSKRPSGPVFIPNPLRLRVKDVDFGRGVITVRSGKGDKDQVTMLPASLQTVLREQLKECRALWESDRAANLAGVWWPDALDRKYRVKRLQDLSRFQTPGSVQLPTAFFCR